MRFFKKKKIKEEFLNGLDYNSDKKLLIVRLDTGVNFVFYNVSVKDFEQLSHMKTKAEVFEFMAKDPTHLHLRKTN